MNRYLQYVLNIITRCNTDFLFTDIKGFMFSTNCKTVWYGTHILNKFFGCDTTICFAGRSSEFGQEIFIVGSFYTSTTNIKEFNMVD